MTLQALEALPTQALQLEYEAKKEWAIENAVTGPRRLTMQIEVKRYRRELEARGIAVR